MRINDVIFYHKKSELRGKLLFALVSIVIHIFPVYYFITAQFDVEIPHEETVIRIATNNSPILLPPIPKTPTKEKSTTKIQFIDGKTVTAKVMEKPKKQPKLPKEPKVSEPEKSEESKSTSDVQPLPESVPEPLPGQHPNDLPSQEPETLVSPSFDAKHYLKPETLEEIYREIQKDPRKRHVLNPDWIPGLSQDSNNSGENDIVMDRQGMAYFKGKGIDISPWARAVVKKINENWYMMAGFSSATGDGGVVGIAVTFKKDGGIATAEVTRTSNNQVLDVSALNAVNMSAPFPEFPKQFPGDSLKVYFLFNYIEG